MMKTKAKAPHLQLVEELYVGPGDPGYVDINALGPEPSASAVARQRRKELRRQTGLFGIAPEPWLLSPDCPLPARWRFYFLLQLWSKQGTRPVHVTNKRVAPLGFDRWRKMRQLRALEHFGLLTLKLDGHKEPFATLCSIIAWPPTRP
jgi:hypothetical protein